MSMKAVNSPDSTSSTSPVPLGERRRKAQTPQIMTVIEQYREGGKERERERKGQIV